MQRAWVLFVCGFQMQREVPVKWVLQFLSIHQVVMVISVFQKWSLPVFYETYKLFCLQPPLYFGFTLHFILKKSKLTVYSKLCSVQTSPTWPQRLDSYRHSTSRKWIKNPTAEEFLGHLLLGFLFHESGVKFSMFCFSQLQKCWGDSFCEDSQEFTDCHRCDGNGSFCRPSGCSSCLWTLLGPE